MKQHHRVGVFMLFIVMAVTTIGSGFPHAGWFVVAAGAVMLVVMLAVEKVKGSPS